MKARGQIFGTGLAAVQSGGGRGRHAAAEYGTYYTKQKPLKAAALKAT